MSQKGLAPILIIVSMFVFLVIGVFIYEEYFDQNYLAPENPTISLTPTQSPLVEGSVARCGDIPDAAYPEYGHYDVRKGPEWSVDCQNIAWSMWHSGTGCIGCPPSTPSAMLNSGEEGIFIYNIYSKLISNVYLKKYGETPVLIKWVDKDNLIFQATQGSNQVKYNYNLNTKMTTPLSS